MIINKRIWGRRPRIIDRSSKQFQEIMDFIEKDVNKTQVGETISASSLYGGVNYDWCKLGYPIGAFYEARYEDYDARKLPDPDEMAKAQAGKDVGNCLQYLIEQSPYEFEVKHNFHSNEYKRIK